MRSGNLQVWLCYQRAEEEALSCEVLHVLHTFEDMMMKYEDAAACEGDRSFTATDATFKCLKHYFPFC